LVAWEILLVEADRLHLLSCQLEDREQRTNVDARKLLVVERGGGRLRHPDRHAEPLAVRRDQVVGRRWSPTSLTNP
jgi:hypothetical protein